MMQVRLLLLLGVLLLAACAPGGTSPAEETPSAGETPVEIVPNEAVVETVTETFTPAVDNAPVDETPVGETPVTPAPITGLPAACFPEDAENAQTGPFVNPRDGYCFQYPAQEGYRVHDVLPIGVAAVWGPPLTPAFEPIRAGLTVRKHEPANGRSLDEVVTAVVNTNPDAEIVDTNATFAGEPAQVVEGIPGMMDSRRHFLIHNDFVYEVTLAPLTQPGEYEKAVMAQRELLWQTVSDSFSWLPQEAAEQFAGCPTVEQPEPDPKSPYVNAPHGYCLLYPAYFGQQETFPENTLVLSGPAQDPTLPDPPRVIASVWVSEANGRTVQQVVDELAAETPELEITQETATLGGEPAIVVIGLPGRMEGRDLFTVHNDQVYRLRVEPLGFPELATDLEAVWEQITSSFHFWR